MDADRFAAYGRARPLAKIAVVDPFQAVRGDLPVGFAHRRDRFRIALQRGGDAEDGDRDFRAVNIAPQPPEAGARAVFVDRFHVHVALAGPGLRADDLRQERFRRGVAVQDVVLAAFLVVEHELDGDDGAARPFRIGRRLRP